MASKTNEPSKKALALSLSQAFDHCPLVLFSFLEDCEAAHVACALCVPQFLSIKRYDIRRELPCHAVVAGFHSGVVRKVRFEGEEDDVSGLPMLPLTVTSMSFVDHVRVHWQPSDLPRSLTKLAYWTRQNQYIRDFSASPSTDWPPGLTDLDFAFYSGPITLASLPSNLRRLSYGGSLPAGDLPSSLTALQGLRGLGRRALSELPLHMTELTFHLPDPSAINWQELSHLSELKSLTSLTLVGPQRNYEAGAVKLPSSLRTLIIFCPFHVIHSLPEALESLTIDNHQSSFAQPIRHPTLTMLQVTGSYNHPIRAEDLPSLQNFFITGDFNQPLDDLPPSLKELGMLSCSHSLDHLPSSLRTLFIIGTHDSPLTRLPSSLRCLYLADYNLPVDHLPASLTELTIGTRFNQRLDHLPSQLRTLKLGEDFNQPLDALPSSLTRLNLRISRLFDRPLDRLPQSLKELILPGGAGNARFRQALHLPDSLQTLDLGDYNQPLRLPRSLTVLTVGGRFNHPLVQPAQCSSPPAETFWSRVPAFLGQIGSFLGLTSEQPPLSLPPSLTRLSFAAASVFSHPLPISSLPERLIYLKISSRYAQLYPELTQPAIRQRCPFAVLSVH